MKNNEKQELLYYVYILRTDRNTLYTGQTNDIEKRLMEHRTKTIRSAKYIRSFESFDLVYCESHPTRNSAMRREREIKSWTKKRKEEMIRNNTRVI